MTEYNLRHKGVRVQNIIAAIELANSLREALGEKTIDDLPKGKPHVASQCILAKAFNFDCQVYPLPFGTVQVFFDKASETQWLAIKNWADARGIRFLISTRCILLPEEVGKLARLFDSGFLPEYDETMPND